MIITGFMLFPFLSLSAQTSWDLRLNNRAQITTPADGSPSQFCSSASSNLIFQVINDGPDNLVLATVSMTATLTLTGNTFLHQDLMLQLTHSLQILSQVARFKMKYDLDSLLFLLGLPLCSLQVQE